MINLAIIGTSWITHDYITGAHATGKYTLTAIYSRKQETASDFASRYVKSGLNPTLYTSLDSLAADKNVDTVYIASVNNLHHAHAKQMLEAGKHVILEKPSTSTSAELDDLFATAKAKKVVLIEAFRHIQEPNFKCLKREIGKLGQLYGASITFAQYSSKYGQVLAGEKPNVFSLDMSSGALVDLGVYVVSAAVELFGAPKSSSYYPVKIATGADGGGRLILQYEGFTVHLCHSKIYNSDAPSEVYGEKGTLVIPTITDIEKVEFWDPVGKSRKVVSTEKNPELNLQPEAEEFARVIEGRDWEGMARYERLSRDILKVTESARRENGLLFPVER